MHETIRIGMNLTLKAFVLSGLAILTVAVVNPVVGDAGCEEDCDCVEEWFYCGPCSEIPGYSGSGDCLLNRCETTGPNQGSCIYNWEDCQDNPDPPWVEECEIS